MNEVVFLTPDEVRYGFSLAGTRQVTVAPQDAETRLHELLTDRDVGVVVIDERLVQAIDAKHVAELTASWRGIMVTLPAPQAGEEEDEFQRLIRRALGYHVRLQV